ncbi:purine-nucleoside phosphorylase [uncultured Desulfosarcina sp.]|uniref:purine-nucleoside phosphorylase n=1 Tax=uncultured Desulfosarcina sp. TaxID=218289 RepID=UPI0029C7EED9|nr:purine-nucleoside phosphorylase [uncultured Desulfosarcina sp.]
MAPTRKTVLEAADFLQEKMDRRPEIAVVTGTGLADAVGPLDDAATFPYETIPHFPVSTVASHSGRLQTGTLDGRPIMVMQGRFHLYEGYTPEQVTFPIRVMQTLGVRSLILSNAAGGMNAAFHEGDLMVIGDHINLTGENPLIGPNEEEWGPRFPDMTAAYDKDLMDLCRQSAESLGIALQSGVYAGLKGPSLETPSEIRYLKTIGADAVGFSTVMETIAAVHAGLRVLALSTITNINDPDRPAPAKLEAIIDVAERNAPALRRLIRSVIARIPKGAAP